MKNLKNLAKIFPFLIAIFLTGCASMAQMQSAMNEIDYFWGNTNKKILKIDGVRLYSASQNEVIKVASATGTMLGFETYEFKDRVRMVAEIPTPFTMDEYESIKKVEEPMMQAIAAKHVGKFSSNFFILSDKDFDILVDLYVTDKTTYPIVPDGKVLVSVSLSLRYTGNPSGMIYGHNPPPEALKKWLKKYWDAFEKELEE